jgi:hypothetical protein
MIQNSTGEQWWQQASWSSCEDLALIIMTTMTMNSTLTMPLIYKRELVDITVIIIIIIIIIIKSSVDRDNKYFFSSFYE